MNLRESMTKFWLSRYRRHEVVYKVQSDRTEIEGMEKLTLKNHYFATNTNGNKKLNYGLKLVLPRVGQTYFHIPPLFLRDVVCCFIVWLLM